MAISNENVKVKIDASDEAIKKSAKKQETTKQTATKAEADASQAKGVSVALTTFTKSAPEKGDYMKEFGDKHVDHAMKLIGVIDTARKTGKELPKEATDAYAQAELVMSIAKMSQGGGDAHE